MSAIGGQRGAWHWLFENADWPWVDLPLKGNPFALWRASRTLRRYLTAHSVDLVHCHYRKAALVGRWIAGPLNLPMLFTLHLTGIPMRGVWRWMSDFGDHTHAPSGEAKRWLIENAAVAPDRITVIPHGIDPSRFPVATDADQAQARSALGVSQKAIVAGFVGRLDDPKNVDWLLDLAQSSRERLPGLIILIAGQGPHEDQLRHRMRRDGLADRVTLLGHRDPLPIYQAIDALLLPSGLEGYSLVCAEAMSVGRPVLRTRTAGASEQIIENVTGVSVPVERSTFVDTAIRCMTDHQALKKMGQAGARHVRQHLTFDRQVDETLELYRRLVGGEWI